VRGHELARVQAAIGVPGVAHECFGDELVARGVGEGDEVAEALGLLGPAVDARGDLRGDDDLRPAFDRAADTIQGEYEYGRAMSAVRRRVTR